ncbi:PAS domain-containing protein, partial [Leisingera daeponensis]|uniref:PAS domain-containing protein n=1 Tax=Leisingera daeponensis TaxID=405746 RepID=UPI001C981368
MSCIEKKSAHTVLYSSLKGVFDHVARIRRNGDILSGFVPCEATRQVFCGVRSVYDTVNRKDKNVLQQLISEAFASPEKLPRGVLRFVGADNTSSWLEVVVSAPLCGDEAVIMANDVTDCVRLKSFSEIVENTMLIGNWELEFTGARAIYLSPNVKRIFEIPESKDISTLNELIELFPPDQKHQLLAASEELVASGTSFNKTLKMNGGQNSEKFVQIYADAQNVDGAVNRIFGTCRDVTERVLKERALSKEKEKAEAASRTK